MAGTPHVAGTVVNSADLNDRVKIYERSTSTVDLVSSTTLTNLYAPTIAANHMSTDRMLRCTIMGDYLNNSGASRNLTLQAVFGGGVLWADTTITPIPASANRRQWRAVIEVANLGAANVQILTVSFQLGSANPGSGGGLGTIDNVEKSTVAGGPGAQDTTVLTALTFQAQHPVNNASLSIRKKYGLLELL
jgi:hypothetical protein